MASAHILSTLAATKPLTFDPYKSDSSSSEDSLKVRYSYQTPTRLEIAISS